MYDLYGIFFSPISSRFIYLLFFSKKSYLISSAKKQGEGKNHDILKVIAYKRQGSAIYLGWVYKEEQRHRKYKMEDLDKSQAHCEREWEIKEISF